MIDVLAWELEFEFDSDGLSLALEFDHARSALIARVTNTSAAPIAPREITMRADLDLTAADGWVWLHGRFMQEDALLRRFAAPPEVGYGGGFVLREDDLTTYTSHEVCVLYLPSQPSAALTVGSLRGDRIACDILLELDVDEEAIEGLSVAWDVDGIVLDAGETLELPPLFIEEGGNPQTLIERFADAAATEMDARVPAVVPTGWCSWYFYGDGVTEADVAANLATMAAAWPAGAIVQIDDGYQPAVGDWLLPNPKFPSGMAALSARIRQAGFVAGLWLAPLVMHEGSKVVREHPEFALRDREGATIFVDTWLGRCAVVDCTQAGAAEWLRQLVRTAVHEWGYGYLKLDALAFAVQPAHLVRYAAAGTTGLANLRRGLEIIREAAGASCTLVGCTCHFSAALGIVDAMRVGPDVDTVWFDGTKPSVRQAMRMTLQRNWMHRRWWANDPDCLVVREAPSELTLPEVRFLAAGIALSGGSAILGDNLSELSEERRALAQALLTPTGVAAIAIDPGEGPIASTWRADLGAGRFVVGVLNWDETSRWVVSGEVLKPGELAFDMFNGTVLGRGDLLLRAHEGSLWQVAAPGPTPRVVGDTGSLTYHELFVRQVSGRVQVRNDGSRGRTIAIEARGQIQVVALAPGEMQWFD